MNSDPHENAAWRTFGMLDADEAASFDEAMRQNPELKSAYQEMDRLAAAIAATTAIPVTPQAGQLERLHARLGLNARRSMNWPAITGWAAAAALAMMMVLGHDANSVPTLAENSTQTRETQITKRQETSPIPEIYPVQNPNKSETEVSETQTASQSDDVKTHSKVETKRLIQQIEILREKLVGLEQRDRQRFESVPGRAWPVVMRMSPPGSAAAAGEGLAISKDNPPIVAMLGDALIAAADGPPGFGKSVLDPTETIKSTGDPSAIPIYDAARDEGTLVVSNLPTLGNGEIYNLWVTPEIGGDPIYVGLLPESNSGGTDTIDFSLGSKGFVPSEFLLTRGRRGEFNPPSKGNTVLLGPE